MYTTNSFVRIAHPSMWSQIPFQVPNQLISNIRNLVAFGTLLIFSLIEMSIAAWLTAKYIAMILEISLGSDWMIIPPGLNEWVYYLLGMSIWTTILGALFWVRFLLNPYGCFTGVRSHINLYALSHSTPHYEFSFEMFPIASFPHGLHGW